MPCFDKCEMHHVGRQQPMGTPLALCISTGHTNLDKAHTMVQQCGQRHNKTYVPKQWGQQMQKPLWAQTQYNNERCVGTLF